MSQKKLHSIPLREFAKWIAVQCVPAARPMAFSSGSGIAKTVTIASVTLTNVTLIGRCIHFNQNWPDWITFVDLTVLQIFQEVFLKLNATRESNLLVVAKCNHRDQWPPRKPKVMPDDGGGERERERERERTGGVPFFLRSSEKGDKSRDGSPGPSPPLPLSGRSKWVNAYSR